MHRRCRLRELTRTLETRARAPVSLGGAGPNVLDPACTHEMGIVLCGLAEHSVTELVGPTHAWTACTQLKRMGSDFCQVVVPVHRGGVHPRNFARNRHESDDTLIRSCAISSVDRTWKLSYMGA
jgi:hypothetical protein